MAVRFNEATKTLALSVRDLIDEPAFHRIGGEPGESWNRMGLGLDLHARILRQRVAANSNYRAEVPVTHSIQIDDWKLVVTGRMDGCRPDGAGGWIVEEFKTAYAPHTHVRPFGASFDRHRQQLLTYCHFWRIAGNECVVGSLVYLDLASGRECAFQIPYEEETQKTFLVARGRQLIADWLGSEEMRRAKADAAERLPFPHIEPRPGQAILMEAVAASLRDQKDLLAEAPTGSGKTAATLHPALREALRTGKQLFFLTAKTLQQKMATEALVAMNPDGAFRTAHLRAKEKMCANDRVLCHEDFCPYAKNYPEKMERSDLLNRLRATQFHHDPSAVFDEAKAERVCPFEVQLELASRADAVVADYNYVFDPAVARREPEDLENLIVLVDEAHNLPDRARQIYSPELLENQFAAALKALPRLHGGESQLSPRRSSVGGRGRSGRLAAIIQPQLFVDDGSGQVARLFEGIEATFQSVVELLRDTARKIFSAAEGEEPIEGFAGERIQECVLPAKELRRIWNDWEPRFVEYLSWKRENKVALTDDVVVDCHFALHRLIAGLTWIGEGFTSVVERRQDGVRIAVLCLDPARPLAPLFASLASTVFLSATLQPFDAVRRVLGLEVARTRSISLPPPFPKENRKILILPQVRTTFGARERSYPRLAQMIAAMADAVPGNVLVLFPSYAFLARVADKLPAHASRLIAQRPNVPDLERLEILRTLATTSEHGNTGGGETNARGKVLLFAVVGGMYAEGVDYPGELLSAVFVVSPALPQVSYERELLRRYFEERDAAGFAYAYLQPGMTRVVQAAGRLIRNETDRGVIALICQRFLQTPYTEYLPRDWFEETPAELASRNPIEDIGKFFAEDKVAKPRVGLG